MDVNDSPSHCHLRLACQWLRAALYVKPCSLFFSSSREGLREYGKFGKDCISLIFAFFLR